MKKIVLLSGKRGGYGAMKTLMRRLTEDSEVDFKLVLTDQHTSNSFGNTSEEVDKSFPDSIKIAMGENSTSFDRRCKGLSTFMENFSSFLSTQQPDYCILYGDRSEVIVAAVSCNIHEIPIIHIQGGDLSGSSDECFRHAITKLSHIHFPSCEESAKRLQQLGENKRFIHVVGDCHVDHVRTKEIYSRDVVEEKLGLDKSKKTIVLLQHSETTESSKSYEQMMETLSAVKEYHDQNLIAIYPCSDPGYQGILNAYKEYENRMCLKLYKNLEAPMFAGLLAIADVLVGNSSCGIIETPVLGLPTVNIGRRQNRRVSSTNVIHVGHESQQISDALKTALYNHEFKDICLKAENPYGDGTSCEKIYNQIKMLKSDTSILQKDFVDYEK